MIRFVDIETGNIFNGEYPYKFYFDNEQGINLIYTKPICFISHQNVVSVTLPQNNTFRLLNLTSWQKSNYENVNIHEFEYVDINDLYLNRDSMDLVGVPYLGFYVYMFYIAASSKEVGEYVEKFYLTENNVTTEYKIAADFYGENEFHYINLSNNGIDIPDSIQKALYPVNIHEDKKDNIILNRKWKELLSNYWDIIANKGSYKSLYNSLNWFEYGDLLKLYEIWKYKDLEKTVYEERDLNEILGDKYFESLNGFAKTTYIAISSALEKMVKDENGSVQYDEEKNPKLEYIIHNMSVQDLSLKLSMLGNFYKTYFMPIHLQCIRSTIEDVVYSNTTKLINSSFVNRQDFVYNINDISCNIKDGDIFRLGPVSARVGKETLFGNNYNNWTKYDHVDIVGVQLNNPTIEFYDVEETGEELINDSSTAVPNYIHQNTQSQLKTYFAQRFEAVGSIINFEIEIPLDEDDFIKRSILASKGDKTQQWIVIEDRKIIKDSNIKFNLLCTKEQEYDIRLEFHSAGGKVYTKRVKFNVIDTNNTSIKIYKVQNILIPSLDASEINEYSFGRLLNNNYNDITKKNNMLYKQYIPAKNINPNTNAHWGYKGICLNHFLIIKHTRPLDKDLYISNNYFTQIRKITNNLIYTICLSKQFGFIPDYKKLKSYNIYRDEYVFYPDFHELVEFGENNEGENISNYTITDQDALCIIPELSYGKLIKEAQWEFVNVSDPNKISIIPKTDIKEPFIAAGEESFLKPGYYNIIFRYRLSGENQINTIELNSAFLKK